MRHGLIGLFARAITATIPAGLVGFGALIVTTYHIPTCRGLGRCVLLPALIAYVTVFLILWFVPDHRKRQGDKPE